MLINILAYASLLIAPFLSGVLLLIIMLPLSVLQFVGLNKIYISYISSLIGGILIVYLYSLFFNWLKIDLGIFAFLLILVPIIINNLQRVKTRPQKEFEKIIGISEVIGLLIGAVLFIFKIV